jgi:hypothetical protein
LEVVLASHHIARAALAVTIYAGAAGSMGYGCPPTRDDCWGFGKGRVEISLIERFDEGTAYQSEERPWPTDLQRELANAPSCGVLDLSAGDGIAIEVEGRIVNVNHCDRRYGRLDGGLPASSGERPHETVDLWLGQIQWSAALYAWGEADLIEGCRGDYSVHLLPVKHMSKEDVLDPPVPGEVPSWIVARVFEPEGTCEGLEVHEEFGHCADTWVARVDAIVTP